jgi:UDP-glucose 6-dehydrogenase
VPLVQIIGCTVLPGYISNVGRYLLHDCENVSLSYNPEFIAQGQIIEGLMSPDIVCAALEALMSANVLLADSQQHAGGRS